MGRMEFLSYGFNFSGDEHFFMIIYIFTAFFATWLSYLDYLPFSICQSKNQSSKLTISCDLEYFKQMLIFKK